MSISVSNPTDLFVVFILVVVVVSKLVLSKMEELDG